MCIPPSLVNFSLEIVKMAEKKDRVSLEDFIKAWESSTDVAEASTKTGLKPTSLMARASKLRTDGVPLKLMQRGASKLDIGKAKEFLANLRGTTVETINQEVDARLATKAEKDATKVETPETPVA